ncbi:MAG: integration host factor subunit beta, partial [Silvanigrellaceae bacterium]|nr:integration host factor subunit beta [Silvanigrellaceae bacterium]
MTSVILGVYAKSIDMIKSKLIASLSSKFSHLPERQIKEAIDCIIETMINALSQGQRIEIRGFGAFSIKNIKERNARNPKTGERVLTPASFKVHFKQGLELKER